VKDLAAVEVMGSEAGGYETVVRFVESWRNGQAIGRQFSYAEFYEFVGGGKQMMDSAFRRLLKALGISQGRNGRYTYADIAVVVGWLTAVDPNTGKRTFSSCEAYMLACGKDLYEVSSGVDFRDFEMRNKEKSA
jgi:hypothetical protein